MNEKTLSIIVKARDEASKVLGDVGDKIAGAMKTATLAVGAAGIAFAAFGVKSAADFEQTRAGMENMLGSADKARGLLSQISKFAADTPFEFPELAGATRQLIAFGFSGEDAFKTMTQLGDVSAAVGAPINDLAYLMGTLRTQGRAFTVDIRQFAQRGIPIYEYLAKVLKTNEQAIAGMIEEGKIGFPEVEKAFQAMTAEGGKFHGAMAKQSKTLSGLFSTLTDNIGQTARELVGINQQGDVIAGSAFDQLRNIAGELINVLPELSKRFQETLGGIVTKVSEVAAIVGDYLLPKFSELWTSIQENIIPILLDLWHNVIEPLLPVIGTALVGAIGAVVDIAKILFDGLGWLYQQMKDGNPIIWGLIGVLGTLAGAMAFNAVFNALTIGFNTLTLITIPSVMASFGALKALIMLPIVMPAIAVGAAIASLILVQQEAQRTMQAVDEALDAEISANNADAALNKRARDYWRDPNSSATQKSWAKKQLGFASGGFTGSGATNDMAGIVHKGEYVVPKSQVNQATGTPMMGGGVFNMYGNFVVDSDEREERIIRRITDMMNKSKEMGALGANV